MNGKTVKVNTDVNEEVNHAGSNPVPLANKNPHMHFISKNKLKLYKFLNRRGDADKIAKTAKVERGTIYVAFCTGRCSEQLSEDIDKFYSNRIQELKKLINATENA